MSVATQVREGESLVVDQAWQPSRSEADSPHRTSLRGPSDSGPSAANEGSVATRLDTYERRTAPALTVMAFVYLALYSVPIIWTGMPAGALGALAFFNILLWSCFALDLIIRASLSGRPAHYLVHHPIDVLFVVLPMFRAFRVLRVFTALQVLIQRRGRASIGETLASAAGAAGLLMFVAAVAMLDAERGSPEAPIQTFMDSLWWSAATVTTVGYGDMYPVTTEGRIIAFALMLVGISIIGIVTASIAAWFVGQGEQMEQIEQNESELVAEIRALRSEVAGLRMDRPRGAEPTEHEALHPTGGGSVLEGI